jgi:hypothetical protein
MRTTIKVSNTTFKYLKRIKKSYGVNTYNDCIAAMIVSQGFNKKGDKQ